MLKPGDRRGDPIIQDALDRGYLDSGEVYQIPGFQSHAAANEGRLSLYRAARRFNLAMAAWVADDQGEQCYQPKQAVSAYCHAPEGEHRVHFRLWSKNSARAHVFRQAQGDPANLKFNPWERKKPPRYTDDGRLES